MNTYKRIIEEFALKIARDGYRIESSRFDYVYTITTKRQINYSSNIDTDSNYLFTVKDGRNEIRDLTYDEYVSICEMLYFEDLESLGKLFQQEKERQEKEKEEKSCANILTYISMLDHISMIDPSPHTSRPEDYE